MKKKLYLGLVLTVTFTAVTFFVANREAEINPLLKANIDALANDEGEGLGGGEGLIGYIPCEEDGVVCRFPAGTASGTVHDFELPGFKNIK